jgi:hypothetical protein
MVNWMSNQEYFLQPETVKKLHTFMNRSRVSNEFGAEKKLKSFDHAINMLLDFALRYEFDAFEKLCNIPLVTGEMKEEDFENEEVRNKIIGAQFDELEK